MKNRKLVYVLVPVVAAIWGLIGYRIYEAVSGGGTDVPPAAAASSDSGNAFSSRDGIPLQADYRDPFLGGTPRGGQSPHRIRRHFPPRAAAVSGAAATPAAEWPAVRYLGIIQNGRSKTRIVLMEINGRSQFMTPGQTAGQVLLHHVLPDSVLVSFRDGKRYIRR